MTTKKTIDVDVRDRIEEACRAIMVDHPEVEAIGVMFLSRHLADVLPGMIVCADGPPLMPFQNVRLFEAWTRIGMQLVTNSQRDVQALDQMLGQYARRIADAQAEARGLQPGRTQDPAEEGGGA